MSSSRALCLLVLVATTASAQEFRRIQPIAGARRAPVTAGTALEKTETPNEVTEAVVGLAPIEREAVVASLSALFEAWNTPRLVEYLGAEFYNQDRLTESLAVQVPRDAELRTLNIESINVISQSQRPLPELDHALAVTTRVSVIVRHQLEFNDPSAGFQAIEGTNEYVLDLTEVIPTW